MSRSTGTRASARLMPGSTACRRPPASRADASAPPVCRTADTVKGPHRTISRQRRCRPATGSAGLPDCEDIDECASSPCQNGGWCFQSADALDPALARDWAGLYFCGCPPVRRPPPVSLSRFPSTVSPDNTAARLFFPAPPQEFQGDHCECRICGPRGSCLPDGTCLCERGFVGETCEENEDDCKSSPCTNGGTCADGLAAYSCICQLGPPNSSLLSSHPAWLAPITKVMGFRRHRVAYIATALTHASVVWARQVTRDRSARRTRRRPVGR